MTASPNGLKYFFANFFLTLRHPVFAVPAAFLLLGPLSAPAMSAARRGEGRNTLLPDRTIIVRASSEYQRAASLLQEYLRKGSRVSHGFPIVDWHDRMNHEPLIIIAVGLTPWTDQRLVTNLWRDGYVIYRADNVVIICGGDGGDERGTFHGAVAFLDRLGIRFYMPGDLWTSIPDQWPLLLPERISVRSEPAVKLSNFTGISEFALDWAHRNAVITRRTRARRHAHNMWNVFNPHKYAATHPEIYPIINGRRYIPTSPRDQNWNPSLSHEQTYRVARREARQYFAENPDHVYFSLGLQDSQVICERDIRYFQPYVEEFYRKFSAGPENLPVSTHGPPARATEDEARRYAMSQLQWRFINRLAADLDNELGDGQFIQAMAYGAANYAPSFELHPRVMLFSQIHVHDNLSGMLDTPLADGTYYLDRFVTAARAYGNHEWYHGSRVLVPRIYCSFHAKFLRHARQRQPDYLFNHIEAYTNWGLDGPKLWVLAQLQWDPSRDVDQLWQQFAEDLFGPAAQPVYDYFSTLRRFYLEQSLPEELGGSAHGRKWPVFGGTMWARIFVRDRNELQLLVEARNHLRQAFALIETSDQYERLRLFSKTFRLTEHLYALGSMETVTPADAGKVRSYYYQVIMPEAMTVYEREPGFIERVISDILRGRRAAGRNR